MSNFEGFAGWEEAKDSGEDFFSDMDNSSNEELSDNTEEVINEVTKEESEEKEDTEKKNSKKEVDLFGDDFEEEETTDEVDDESKNSEIQSSSIQLLNSLKNRGFLDFELEEDEELTEDLAEELLEEKYEEALEIKLEEKLTNVPDEAKELISFVLKGGSVSDYLSASKPKGSLAENMDLTEESNQELVVREIMRMDEEDEEAIETQIELLKDSGRLENFATKKYQKWLNEFKKNKAALLEKQNKQKEQDRKAEIENKRVYSKILKETESFGDIIPSKEDRNSIPAYMNDKSITLQNGVAITNLQKELYWDLPKNKTAMIQLAILMKNRNEDGTFNFKSIKDNLKTETTKKLKKELRRGGAINAKASEKQTRVPKALADIFS